MDKWFDVPGFEGLYQVTEDGRVRSLRVLKPWETAGSGYLSVYLGDMEGLTAEAKGRRYIHSVVAETFLGPCPKGMEVNHIDGNRQNNNVTNLEYVTRKQNNHHAFKIGNRKHYFTEEQMDVISKKYFVDGISVSGIARELNGSNDIPSFKRMRKKVRSVIGIWRAQDRKGTKNPYERKLTIEDARKIRKLYKVGGVTQKQLGAMFSYDASCISRIISGYLWPDKEEDKD